MQRYSKVRKAPPYQACTVAALLLMVALALGRPGPGCGEGAHRTPGGGSDRASYAVKEQSRQEAGAELIKGQNPDGLKVVEIPDGGSDALSGGTGGDSRRTYYIVAAARRSLFTVRQLATAPASSAYRRMSPAGRRAPRRSSLSR